MKKPSESATNEEVGKFIKDKYVKRLYVPKNAMDPVQEFLEKKNHPDVPEKPVVFPPQQQLRPAAISQPPIVRVAAVPAQIPIKAVEIPQPVPPAIAAIQKADLLDYDFNSDVPQKAPLKPTVASAVPLAKPLEVPLHPISSQAPLIKPLIPQQSVQLSSPSALTPTISSPTDEQKRKLSAPAAPLQFEAEHAKKRTIDQTQFMSSPMQNLYIPYANQMLYGYPYYTQQPMMGAPRMEPEQMTSVTMQKIPANKLAQLKQGAASSVGLSKSIFGNTKK